MTTIPPFRLQVAPPTLGTAGPSATGAPLMLCLDLGKGQGNAGIGGSGVSSDSSDNDIPDDTETPANSIRKGSFNYDREKGGFAHEWSSLAEFDAWRRQEELAYSIELVTAWTSGPSRWLYTQKKIYCCSRQQTGGDRHYQKKFPDRYRKIESKKTGCRCQLTIKLYPHTQTVLGRYDADHDHPIGLANIAYTRISRAAREKINVLLEQRVHRNEIVRNRSFFW
jgi:hypothetical protein